MELLPANLSVFFERFSSFYDGIIRQVKVSFVSGENYEKPRGVQRSVKVIVSVQDQESLEMENQGWVNLELHIINVSVFRFIETEKLSSVVLSYGISIKFFYGLIYIRLDEEAEETSEFDKADFLIIGTHCFWTVLPYSSNDVK